MRSVGVSRGSGAVPPGDLTARSRIRDAALHRFAVDGFAGTSIRAVADDAGVSAALVIHHFGSKEGLRTACDEHLVESLTRTKRDAIDQSMSATGFLAALDGSGDVMAYLGRALTDGSPQAAALFDAMVEMSAELLGRAAEGGMVRPSPDERARAAVLTTWQLGLLVLSDHLSRALGEPVASPAGLLRVERVAIDLYTHGMFSDDRWVALADEAARLREDGPTTHGGEE